MSRRTALLALAALLLPRALAAQPAAAGPTTAGIYAAPAAAGGATYLWNREGLFRVRAGPEVEEITGPEGEPLRSVRGLAAGGRGATWVWTEDRLLSVSAETAAAVEILSSFGTSLGGLRGAAVDENGVLWAWTASDLFLHRSGTRVERAFESGSLVGGITGVASVRQGVLAWGGEGVFEVHRETGQATAIAALTNEPIRSHAIDGLVVSGNHPCSWNSERAWDVFPLYNDSLEVRDAAGAPLTGIRGMAAGADALIWLWTDRGLFGLPYGSSRATEVLDGGRSVAAVRGIVSGPSGALWFWTRDRLMVLQPGSFTAVEVTAPSGGPVRDLQGLVAGAGGALFWTRNRVLELRPGETATIEVSAPGGGPLGEVSGIVAGPERAVIWTGDGVFLHEPATATTVEVTAIGGGPIRNVWAAVPRADADDFWIRNHASAYALDPGATAAVEVLDPAGRPIPSPPYNLPLLSAAIARTAEAGAGAPDSFAPGATFAGAGASGGVLTERPLLLPAGPVPVVAGEGFQSLRIGQGWTVVSRAGAAVLSTGVEIPFAAARYETRRASVDARAREGDAPSGAAAVSGDGRYIAFGSEASNLVAGDANGSPDVFVHDRLAGTTERVAPPGVDPDGASGLPAISADGGHVSFSSGAGNLVGGDSNGESDVFVWSRKSGAVERVSVGSGGGQALGGASTASAISADGRFVAFDSAAVNLVGGDTNLGRDVFVHDRAAGTTERVSVSSTGAQGDGASSSPAISADGRFVAFVSVATRLVPGDTNGEWDVFVHDRLTGATERVNVSSEGLQQSAAGAAFSTPRLSDDGRFVAFDSASPDLVAGDTNGSRDVFVRDRAAGTTERVSLAGRREQVQGPSRRPSLSGDGRYVSFESEAVELPGPDSPPGPAILVRDRLAGVTRVASRSFLGGLTELELGGVEPSLSAGGRFVAFSSSGETRPGASGNGVQDVLVRDRGAPDAVFPWTIDDDRIGWRTDAFIHNPGDDPLVLDLTFFKRGIPHPDPPVEGITVGARETVLLENLLPDVLGMKWISGAVELDLLHRYSDVEPVATFQVRKAAPGGGFYGKAGPAQPLLAGETSATGVRTLVGLDHTEDRRSFLILHTLRQDRAVYDLAFFDPHGNPVGTPQRDLVLGPGSHTLFGPEALDFDARLDGRQSFRVEVTTTSGAPVQAFASTVHVGSSDAFFIPPARPGRPRVHVLGAVASSGAQGNRWTTDAVLYNPAAVPVQVRMTFIPAGRRARPRGLGPPVALAPRETLRLRNVLQDRGVPAAGAITFASDGAPSGVYPVVAAEAIEITSPDRRFGRDLPALRDEDAAGEGERSLLVGLRQDAEHRTTLWLFNPGGDRGAYELRYRDLTGHVVATSKLALEGGRLVQINPARLPAAVDGLRAFTLEVAVRRGRLLASAAVASAATGDPMTVVGEAR